MSAASRLGRTLPARLEPLAELALDLRFTGSRTAGRVWESLDPEAWERTKNPFLVLVNAEQQRLEEAASNEQQLADLDPWLARRQEYLNSNGWFGQTQAGSPLTAVAYFSMEFGLSEGLPIYSGGLGMLAGDHLKSASDLGVPLVGIGLLYQQGYFRQVLSADASQLEAFPYNDPSTLPVTRLVDRGGSSVRVTLELPGRTLHAQVWEARVGRVRLYLLDSNDVLNTPWDRGITANLYDAGKEKRLLQEILLGVGGWKLLEQLGQDVEVCHLNEGHAALAVVARAASFAERHGVPFAVALRATRAGNLFTTHTPVEAAFDRFDPALVAHYARGVARSCGLSMDGFLALGRRDPRDASEPFNMAYLAMQGCGRANGVSRLHAEVSRGLFSNLFPSWPPAEVPIGHITNGVHVPTWASVPTSQLWGEAYDHPHAWSEDLETAASAVAQLSDHRLWDFRAAARRTLVEYVRRRLVRQVRQRGATEDAVRTARHVLDPNFLTLGFARRFTEYKRPNLLLHDAARFARILTGDSRRPVQFVVAGKAHPNDDGGKAMVQAMARFASRPDMRSRVVFLEDYDMVLGQHLAAGVDVWINNPRRPAEACGTSGMKMMVNGGLHLSVLDGWWDEAFDPALGWALGDRQEHGPERDPQDADQLYQLLENEIVREFYERDEHGVPRAWIQRVRASMTRLTPQFSSGRMVREYVETGYIPAALEYRRRSADDAKLAVALESWQEALREGWPSLRFGELRTGQELDDWHFQVQLYLGDLSVDWVRVELYADGLEGGEPERIPMQRIEPILGAINGFLFGVSLPATRPLEHYTPRVVAHHAYAFVPGEATEILWYS